MTPSPAPQNPVAEAPSDELIDEESLVEEGSIDGMCGVY